MVCCIAYIFSVKYFSNFCYKQILGNRLLCISSAKKRIYLLVLANCYTCMMIMVNTFTLKCW